MKYPKIKVERQSSPSKDLERLTQSCPLEAAGFRRRSSHPSPFQDLSKAARSKWFARLFWHLCLLVSSQFWTQLGIPVWATVSGHEGVGAERPRAIYGGTRGISYKWMGLREGKQMRKSYQKSVYTVFQTSQERTGKAVLPSSMVRALFICCFGAAFLM